MSAPLARPDVKEKNVPAYAGAVETPTASSMEAPQGLEVTESAGARTSASQSAPLYEPEDAIRLLVSTVSDMRAAGRNTAAAGVSARMVQIDSSFRANRAGFTNFRALLGEAANRGLIQVHKPFDASDVVITLSPSGLQNGDVESDPLTSSTVPQGSLGGWLRRDLWQALRDFSGTDYVYDKLTLRTSPVNSIKAGSKTDGDVAKSSMQRHLRVPIVDADEQLAWMHDFVENETPTRQRPALAAVLDGESPSAEFESTLLGVYPLRRRWDRYLRLKLMARAKTWATAEGLVFDDLLSRSLPALPATDTGLDPTIVPPSVRSRENEALRSQILDVLGRLPLSELLRISLPLDYTMRR